MQRGGVDGQWEGVSSKTRGGGKKDDGGVKIKTWTRQAQVGCWGGQKKDRGWEKSPGGSEKRRARDS